MANAVYKLSNINKYSTTIGNVGMGIKTLSWNTGNYVNPTGYSADKNSFGLRGFDTAWGGISKGGNYEVRAQILSGSGGRFANFRLFVLSTGLEVANGVALIADSVTVGAIGG
jgi:hypothetical protein